MNFEFQNYTIITSQCKGPKFPPKECCGSFKEFACPFTAYINDESNDCASTMFSYINLYGKYPPGLFAHECREGKEGLSCKGVPQRNVVASGGQRARSSSLALITIVCGLVSLLFHWVMIVPYVSSEIRQVTMRHEYVCCSWRCFWNLPHCCKIACNFKSRPVTYFLESQLIANLEFTGCRCVVPLTLHYVSPMCIMVFILLVWSSERVWTSFP